MITRYKNQPSGNRTFHTLDTPVAVAPLLSLFVVRSSCWLVHHCGLRVSLAPARVFTYNMMRVLPSGPQLHIHVRRFRTPIYIYQSIVAAKREEGGVYGCGEYVQNYIRYYLLSNISGHRRLCLGGTKRRK